MSKAQALIAEMRAWAADECSSHPIDCYTVRSKVNGLVAFFKEDIDGKSDSEMLEMLHNRLVKPLPRHAE